MMYFCIVELKKIHEETDGFLHQLINTFSKVKKSYLTKSAAFLFINNL